jgi:hypothetical protein
MNLKRILKRVAIAAGVLLLVAVVGFVALLYFMFPHTTHRLVRYESIRRTWQSELQLLAQFPETIPVYAKKPRMSFYPGFLQGGAHFQIRYGLPPDEIRSLHGAFAKDKTKSFFGGDCNDHMNQSNGMPTTSFYTGPEGHGKFPKDYEIMIFDAVLTNRPPGFYWNHGRSHGVAISTSRNEIVYWAEAW